MSWDESWWITRNIVKSIQRGKTSTAQTVTINSVNLEKSIVLSVSKGSDGYVAARGRVAGTMIQVFRGAAQYLDMSKTGGYGYDTSKRNNIELSISEGSTDLTVKQYSATLTSPTTLVTDGACEWQVIEFN